MTITPPSNIVPSNATAAAGDLHRPLYVVKIDPQDHRKIGQIAAEWQSIAVKKWHETDLYDEKTAWSQLRGNNIILGHIESHCTNQEPDHHATKELYVCKDMNNEIYGIAMIERTSRITVKGHLLATHPINIRCKANLLETKRVEGVGRTFIQFAQQEMLTQKVQTITLNPINSAIFFYLKFGFQPKDGEMIKRSPTYPEFQANL